MLASPEALAAGVEEMLRFNTIVQYNSARVATADVEIAGHTIRAGDGVYALLTAANHDPAAFPDPERFDASDRLMTHRQSAAYWILPLENMDIGPADRRQRHANERVSRTHLWPFDFT